jgi:hypothetical protein
MRERCPSQITNQFSNKTVNPELSSRGDNCRSIHSSPEDGTIALRVAASVPVLLEFAPLLPLLATCWKVVPTTNDVGYNGKKNGKLRQKTTRARTKLGRTLDMSHDQVQST